MNVNPKARKARKNCNDMVKVRNPKGIINHKVKSKTKGSDTPATKQLTAKVKVRKANVTN